MPMRLSCRGRTARPAGSARRAALAACVAFSVVGAISGFTLAGCASTPAEPVPFKPVPAERIVRQGYTQPGPGLVAVDVRRERSRDVIVRFRDALVYIDGERITDLMNGEHVVFYLPPGAHRIGVSTQFDPVIELNFIVTADPRYTNRASVTFNDDHRIGLQRVAQ
ncbi:hypothetical protein EVC45_24090 [Paraburkholderia sp. UYCP14C]|uniref:hypothetical protein n=1 Tax=Paraburkholderia sp. UYCP14C TaxID=2511130 RepID=UPI0010217603|nr:hypothetical protein [Paraburkholderia sp. UYCP14C]RZF27261.1 hypothetical protein EVC45_24090 [Paraburkholderia sp. UYCP14C]